MRVCGVNTSMNAGVRIVRAARVHPREPLASRLRGVVGSLPGASRPGTMPRRKRHHRPRPDLRALIHARPMADAPPDVYKEEKKIKENNAKAKLREIMTTRKRHIPATMRFIVASC